MDLGTSTRPQLAIFGGSFNPVTKGHLKIVASLLGNPEIAKVVVVPCGERKDKPDLLSGALRIEMLQLAFKDALGEQAKEVNSTSVDCLEGAHRLFIDTFEITGDNHMVPTSLLLQHYQAVFPQYEVWFVLGSDLLGSIHTWQLFESFLRHQPMMVFLRSPSQLSLCHQLKRYKIQNDAVSVVSSTEVRKRLQGLRRVSPGDSETPFAQLLEQLVEPAVAQFIIEHQLYSDPQVAI